MMRQKRAKKLSLILIATLLTGMSLFLQPVDVNAASESVYDEAGLLTSSEIREIKNEVSDLEAKSGWEVFVMTTDDANGYTTRRYSEAFLNDHLTGDDGIVFTIDMDNREVYLATTGEAIRYLTDDRIDDIIDSGYNDVADGYYADAFLAMLDTTYDYYRAGIPSNQYTYNTNTGEIDRYKEPRSLEGIEIVIVIAVALIVFAVIFGSVVGKYRVKWGNHKYDYHENSDVHLRRRDDRFVNQTTTHRRIPRNDSSGSSHSSGRSSVHSGSGGRSYGGGGRKF